MFTRLPETKVMRDPIHGYIHVDLAIVWELIDTLEFQRLRRIHQLGGTYMVYHTAEHSRFSHSLGVYEIVRRMVYDVSSIRQSLSEYELVTVLLAGLLHDIGHGPFSHAFESIIKENHEEMSVRILLEDTTIHQILTSADDNLAKQVAMVITHTHPNPLLCQLVSGQLDADRMDYLLRDSYMTGTSYGNFDLERILRTLRVKNQRLVIKESGIHTIEDYIMSRYHMYWQVYFHPLSRSYEAMLGKLFLRLRDLNEEKSPVVDEFLMFHAMIKKTMMSVHEYLALDESAVLYGMQLMSQCQDPILKDLATRLLQRNLFAFEVMDSDEQKETKRHEVESAGYASRYYFHQDQSKSVPYKPYITKGSDVIEVLKEDGTTLELSEVSIIVSSILQGKLKDDRRMFFPKECRSKRS